MDATRPHGILSDMWLERSGRDQPVHHPRRSCGMLRDSPRKFTQDLDAVVCEALSMLRKRLRRAGKQSLTVKPLHDLRVACRRAEAALWLTKPLTKSSPRRWLLQRLRQIRRMSNPVRDADVLLEWLAAHPHVEGFDAALRRDRDRGAIKLGKLAKQISQDSEFLDATRRLHQRLESCQDTAAASIGRRLFKLLDQFVLMAGSSMEDPRAMHRWRVVGKRLRYSLTFVAELSPLESATIALETLKTIQDRLGDLHDRHVRQALGMEPPPASCPETGSEGSPEPSEPHASMTPGWHHPHLRIVQRGVLEAILALWTIPLDNPSGSELAGETSSIAAPQGPDEFVTGEITSQGLPESA